jgi:DNA (cytosine-5)-methyltransferase 1
VGAKGVADTQLHGRDAIPVTGGIGTSKDQGWLQQPEGRSAANRGGVAHSNNKRLEGRPEVPERADQLTTGEDGLVSGMGNTNESGRGQGCETATTARHGCATDTAGWTNGFWQDADWLPFRDSKIRPVEPGTFPMAPRTPNHVGRCRAYGNAIVAPLATEFIKAYMSLTDTP